MAEKCPNPRVDCKYFGTPFCIITKHHEIFPRVDYPTKTEKAYRNLPEHIKPLRHCDHEELHAKISAPEKPSIEVMRQAIAESALHRTVEVSIPYPPVLNVFELDDYRD